MNENKVELLGVYGSDITHAQSAWTSTERALSNEKIFRIPKLLKMLADNGHETPFEKSFIHFLVTCDVATHIQLLKHRIGVSINAESARYKELKEDRFFVPDDWPVNLQETLDVHMKESYALYHYAIEQLVEEGFSRKRAKESARFFLPYANQTTMDVAFNFRSFVHFLRLRNKPDAQKEIKDVAQKMLDLVQNMEGGENPFQYSIEAFKLNGEGKGD
jgi:thymidylate synthase (FAD)